MSFWLKISRGMCTVGANQQVNTSSKRSSRNDILIFFPFYCLLGQGSMPYIICISLCAKHPLNLFLKSLEWKSKKYSAEDSELGNTQSRYVL